MATAKSQLIPIQITPGVQPNTDRTPLSTPHFTASDKIRFWRGIPQKIGGWLAVTFTYGSTISGIARTLYSAIIDNIATTVIGTDSNLYALYGQTLTNISPVLTTTIPIANSISTDFSTLSSNPITTQNGTGNITVSDTNSALYQINDSYTLSGSTSVNGIADTLINTKQTIIAIGTNTVTFMVNGTATSSSSGGGASVVRATGLLTFAATANAQTNGNRVKIAGAATTGGISDTLINAEFILRNVQTNSFDVMTSGTATSAVTAGGGSGTTYQTQIPAGGSTQSFGFGYGAGLYGTGLYGTSRISSTGIVYPRIWFIDRFGDRLVMTPGNQSPIYLWDGSVTTAPEILENAPTDINYVFVSNSIVVTFGHQDVGNQIFASDQFDATNWTASSSNQVFQQVLYGADRLISSVPVLGTNLIFTTSQTYTFSYIGLPLVWSIQLIDNSVGIIGPMARCSVNNIAFWMGQNNFYMWSGGNVTIIPANTQSQCTMLKYVFGNINYGQAYKCFAWYNENFNEVWFHYPSSGSQECNRIARVSLDDLTWSPDTMDRTCAEYPNNLFFIPRMISSGGIFYNHETGNNDNTNPLPFTLTSNLRNAGKETGIISGFLPDNLTSGDMNVNLTAYLYPQSTTPTFVGNYVVADNGPRENITIGGRYWTYTWSGGALNQPWIMGSWMELGQKGAPN